MHACPAADELVALQGGRLPNDRLDQLVAHLDHCPRCQSTVDALEETSDWLVRMLAAVPCRAEDEPAFRQLYGDLLTRPEPFSGSAHGLTDAEPLDEAGEPLPRRLGKYELIALIGRGAAGRVYRARHLNLDRLVTIKVLDAHPRAGDQTVAQFMREMRAVGRLDHPHIIRATDAGQVAGQYYLVMEAVDGIDLSGVLRQTGPLRVADACEVVRQTICGLDFAHRHDMVHRDVKPSNLLLTADGCVKLLDLGLVDLGDTPHTGQTVDDQPRGTADYMSPEQWTNYTHLDARADYYSLGCTLFKLLTGRAPYQATAQRAAEKRAAHLRSAIPRLSDFRSDTPPALVAVVSRLLAKEPAARLANADELLAAVTPLTAGADLLQVARQVGLPVEATRPAASPGQFSGRRRWRRRAWLAAAATAAGSVLLASREWFRWRSVKQVRTGIWRDVQPIGGDLWLAADEAARLDYLAKSHRILVESRGPAVVPLGRPVRTPFSLRAVLSRERWLGGAGFFFRFRIQGRDDRLTRSFHAIEFRAVPRPEGPPDQRLIWSRYQCQRQGPEYSFECTPWADATLADEEADGQHELQITLGQEAFPIVYWDGELWPESRWILSHHARRERNRPPDQLDVFFGRVGLLNSDGATCFEHVQLRYES